MAFSTARNHTTEDEPGRQAAEADALVPRWSGTGLYGLVPLVGVPREGGGSIMVFAFQIFAIIAIFYFLLIRPQRKEQQRHRNMVAGLKKGDEVVTAGGIVGKVIHAREEHLTIVTAESTRLVIERSKVAALRSPRAS